MAAEMKRILEMPDTGTKLTDIGAAAVADDAGPVHNLSSQRERAKWAEVCEVRRARRRTDRAQLNNRRLQADAG